MENLYHVVLKVAKKPFLGTESRENLYGTESLEKYIIVLRTVKVLYHKLLSVVKVLSLRIKGRISRQLGDWIEIKIDAAVKSVQCDCERCNT